MAAESWSGIVINAGSQDAGPPKAPNGDLTQLFPPWMPVGVDKAVAQPGDQIRTPQSGYLHSVQVQTDDTNGGILEIWDISGDDLGVNVSSADTITDAQLQTAIANGQAKLLFSDNFISSSGARSVFSDFRVFSKGLAARFSNVGPAGYCVLNLVVTNGATLNETAGL